MIAQSKGRNGLDYPDYGGAILLRGTADFGVKSENSTLTLTSCTFRNNTSIGDSGAIDNIGATIIATDTTFSDNNSGGVGGAIFSAGFATFTGCEFTGNTATDVGGAIYTTLGEAVFTDTIFSNNDSGESGGAIGSIGSPANGDARITATDTIFSNNAAARNGGAVYSFGLATFVGCDFIGNTADNAGGAIVTQGVASDFDNCKFIGNIATGAADFFQAGDGGAIVSAAETTVKSTLFKCNFAVAGGAILHLIGGQLSMDDVEVTANTAIVGGGIFLGDEFGTITSDFDSSRFYQNAASEGGAIYFDGPDQSSLIDGTVFQSNTALAQAIDIFNENPSTVECGAGHDNCFCDADSSTDISTNDLPTTCAGDGVGSTCPGCTPPAAPIVCDGDNGFSGAGVLTRAEDNNPPDMDIEEMLKNVMENLMETKTTMETKARRRSGQNRRH